MQKNPFWPIPLFDSKKHAQPQQAAPAQGYQQHKRQSSTSNADELSLPSLPAGQGERRKPSTRPTSRYTERQSSSQRFGQAGHGSNPSASGRRSSIRAAHRTESSIAGSARSQLALARRTSSPNTYAEEATSASFPRTTTPPASYLQQKPPSFGPQYQSPLDTKRGLPTHLPPIERKGVSAAQSPPRLPQPNLHSLPQLHGMLPQPSLLPAIPNKHSSPARSPYAHVYADPRGCPSWDESQHDSNASLPEYRIAKAQRSLFENERRRKKVKEDPFWST
ncbi:hypothetical protein DFJ77DRAFT_39474 [Powellomyces hirtus]|nr:hypothetical protein DFJ77DRAFT_39474 [Powellomyces hirtus]